MFMKIICEGLGFSNFKNNRRNHKEKGQCIWPHKMPKFLCLKISVQNNMKDEKHIEMSKMGMEGWWKIVTNIGNFFTYKQLVKLILKCENSTQ